MSNEKVILITGASRGIGHAISLHLLNHTTSNIVVTSRSTHSLETLSTSYPARVLVVACDASDLSLGEKAVNAALQKWNRLDGVVVNHGQVEPVQRVVDAELDEWKAAFDINVFSAVVLCKAAIPSLRANKGRIIFTSSGAAVKGTSTWGCYGAGKAVLNHLALTLAAEEKGIATVSIRPGVVDTKMQDTLAAEHHGKMEVEDAQRFKDMKAQGKMLRPEQPGNVMARLVVGAPSELSGKFLNWNDEELKDFQD